MIDTLVFYVVLDTFYTHAWHKTLELTPPLTELVFDRLRLTVVLFLDPETSSG